MTDLDPMRPIPHPVDPDDLRVDDLDPSGDEDYPRD